MNERVKEITEQCYHPYSEHHINLEKFAELIVRECVAMAKAYRNHEYDFTGNLELHEFMLEHFGIE